MRERVDREKEGRKEGDSYPQAMYGSTSRSMLTVALFSLTNTALLI